MDKKGHACMLSCFSHVWFFVTLWTIAHQGPLSQGFSRQEYWSGLPWPPPGDLPGPGIKPASLMSPALAGKFFTTIATWEAPEEWLTSANSPEVIYLTISHRTECSEVNLWTWIITYKLFALFCSHSLYLNLTVYLMFLSPLISPILFFSFPLLHDRNKRKIKKQE